jgi:hypothetical protein
MRIHAWSRSTSYGSTFLPHPRTHFNRSTSSHLSHDVVTGFEMGRERVNVSSILLFHLRHPKKRVFGILAMSSGQGARPRDTSASSRSDTSPWCGEEGCSQDLGRERQGHRGSKMQDPASGVGGVPQSSWSTRVQNTTCRTAIKRS